jgi:beta-galactosidase
MMNMTDCEVVNNEMKTDNGSLRIFSMKMMAFLWAMSCFFGAPTGFAQTDVTLKVACGGPQILLNGNPIPARMFWAQPGYGTVAAQNEWSEQSFEFTSAFDANGTVHFRFGTKAGQVWLSDVRLTSVSDNQQVIPVGSFATQTGFAKQWNMYPSDASNTVGTKEIVDSSLHVTLIDPPAGTSWPDFHFYSNSIAIKANTKYRCSFRVRATPDRPITPTVYHTANGSWTPIGGPPGVFETQVKLARDAGVNLITFNVANCWLPPEKAPDWQPLDAICQSIVNMNPNVLLIPRISLDAPDWWKALYPNALMQFEDNSRGTKVSISDRRYRTDAAAHLEKLCKHLLAAFPKNFAGIHPSGQNTGEWFYDGMWNAKMSGYDSSTRAAWQAWPGGATDIPSAASRRTASSSLLLNPATQQQAINFNYFLQAEMADFVTTLAAAARRGTDGRKLVLFFYGYHYECSNPVNGPAVSGHFALSRVLASPDIDILSGPISYNDRQLLGTGPLMSSVESVTASGKLWCNEDDTRTYLTTNLVDAARYGGLADLAQTQSVLLRNTAQASLRGLGTWWMDHGAGTGGGWFADPALWEIMSQMRPIDDRMLSRAQGFTPDIAAVIDEGSMMHVAGGSTALTTPLIYQSRAALGRCGAPYGQYMLDDILTGKVKSKLQIFLAAWALTSEQRQLLASTRPSGVTRVWCYAPGLINLSGKSDTVAMREVTGFSFRPVSLATAVATPTAAGKKIGVMTAWGPAQKITPLFSVAASADQTLAVYSDGSPAVAMRESDQGRDVFIGPPQLTSELIRALANVAGVHLFTQQDASVWAAENFLSVHTVQDQPLLVNTATSNAVTDAFTAEAIGTGPEFTWTMGAGDTRVVNDGTATSIDSEAASHAMEFSLDQNYPNPFNPTTAIRFSLPASEYVSLTIYDFLGREVLRLVDGKMGAGSHTINCNLSGRSSGVYFYRMQAGRFIQTKPLLLLK